MSHTDRRDNPLEGYIIARVWETVDDSALVRNELREAVKEVNGSGDTDLDARNWERRIGLWID